jgi:PIN domain nuclease of toxin-antitoxin system
MMENRCFLDTTYLMPLFGLSNDMPGFDDQFLAVLKKGSITFFYSPVSIIEIKWQVIKLEKTSPGVDAYERMFSRGLTSMKNDPRFQVVDLIDASINDVSVELRKLGHNDYFDTIIASSALWHADVLVTEDDPLKKTLHAFMRDRANDLDVGKIAVQDWSVFCSLHS